MLDISALRGSKSKSDPFSTSTLNFLSNDTYVVDSRARDLELRGPKNGEKFEEEFVFAIRSSFSLLTIYQTSSRLDIRQKGIMIAQIDRKFNKVAKNRQKQYKKTSYKRRTLKIN